MKTPTFDDIRQERYDKCVHEEVTSEWRWGNYYFNVYRFGDKLWAASFRTSQDGETNDLHDQPDHELTEVKAVEVTSIEYHAI